MCLAVPARIVECDGDRAVVDIGGVRRSCCVTFVEDPNVGDYVLLHAGFAIQKWTTADLDSYNAVLRMADGGARAGGEPDGRSGERPHGAS